MGIFTRAKHKGHKQHKKYSVGCHGTPPLSSPRLKSPRPGQPCPMQTGDTNTEAAAEAPPMTRIRICCEVNSTRE